MKKIITIMVIISIIIISTLAIIRNNKVSIKDSAEQNQNENKLGSDKMPSYYNEKYSTRYEDYAKQKPNLSIEEIVKQVNIGLDHKHYTNTKVTPYPNKSYILVNKYISLPNNYIPNNLDNLDTSYSRSGMKLVKNAKDMLEKMVEQAKNDGYTIRVMSSYRNYDYQVKLYNEYKRADGEEEADKYSARPGFSEHQTGLCIDIDDGIKPYTSFAKSESYKWMQNNSYKYGFIERYPQDKEQITGYNYEAWHYRYVGKNIAKYIHDNNITFDEYYVMFIENKK